MTILVPGNLLCDYCTASQACRCRADDLSFLQELLASCDPALAGGMQPFSSRPAPHAAAGAAQKQQRAVMAELRGLVPSAAAALLAASLLEAGQVLPPVSDAAGEAADAQSTGAATQLHGWQACMAMLQQDYPSLPGLLLASSLADLATADIPASAQSVAWARLLLRHAVLSDGSSRSQGDPGFAWQPTRAQVLQVVATCITALQGSGPAQPAIGPKQPVAVLLDAALVLLQHIDDRMPHSAASTAAATCALQVILHST